MIDEIILREVRQADLPIFFAHQLDPDAARMADFPSRDHGAFMAHWAKSMADPTVVLKTIVFHGEVAGNIVSWEQAGEFRVGYWLGKEYWGQGITTAALLQFLKQVNVRPLVARVSSHNLASKRVLEKCGFIIDDSCMIFNSSEPESEEIVLRLGG